MSTNVQPHLLEMPEIVMDIILEKIGFRSIMTLRKVCHSLRDYIDEKKPEANFTKLECLYGDYAITFKYSILDGKTKSVAYRKKDDGCLMNHKNKEIQMNNVSMEELFFGDFENIFKFQRKELKELSIFNDHFYGKNYSKFLTKMGEIISKFSPLKVKNLSVHAVGENSIFSILQSSAPGILKYFGVQFPFNPQCQLEFTQIVQLEQWKQLETIWIFSPTASPEIEHFLHLSSARLTFESVSARELAAIKEAFLHRPHIKKFYISYTNFGVEHQFEALVGRAIEENHIYKGKRWFFRIPGTVSELLYIYHLDEYENSFEFRRIDESKTEYPIPTRE